MTEDKKEIEMQMNKYLMGSLLIVFGIFSVLTLFLPFYGILMTSPNSVELKSIDSFFKIFYAILHFPLAQFFFLLPLLISASGLILFFNVKIALQVARVGLIILLVILIPSLLKTKSLLTNYSIFVIPQIITILFTLFLLRILRKTNESY